jgi:hypothetical protein
MAPGPARLAVARIHEHQVDIRTVVQLLAAELAQRDHGKTAGRGLAVRRFKQRLAITRRQLPANLAIGEVQDGVGQVGQLAGDVRQRGEPQHVAQQDAQRLPPAEARQEKRAIGEHIHRRLQGSRRTADAVEGGWRSLPHALQVSGRRLRDPEPKPAAGGCASPRARERDRAKSASVRQAGPLGRLYRPAPPRPPPPRSHRIRCCPSAVIRCRRH